MGLYCRGCTIGLCHWAVLWGSDVGLCYRAVLWGSAMGLCYGAVLWGCAMGLPGAVLSAHSCAGLKSNPRIPEAVP